MSARSLRDLWAHETTAEDDKYDMIEMTASLVLRCAQGHELICDSTRKLKIDLTARAQAVPDAKERSAPHPRRSSDAPDGLRVEFGQNLLGREKHVQQPYDVPGPLLGLQIVVQRGGGFELPLQVHG